MRWQITSCFDRWSWSEPAISISSKQGLWLCQNAGSWHETTLSGGSGIPKQNWVVVSSIFYFHPYLGKIPILTMFFLDGWFNHQLVNLSFFLLLMRCKTSQPLPSPKLQWCKVGISCIQQAYKSTCRGYNPSYRPFIGIFVVDSMFFHS